MMKIRIGFILLALFSTQQVFANDVSSVMLDSPTSHPCAAVAKACAAAGFFRTEAPGKNFWKDCMKPVVLGQTVQGVTIDSTTAQACRAAKITELQIELNDLQKSTVKQLTKFSIK